MGNNRVHARPYIVGYHTHRQNGATSIALITHKRRANQVDEWLHQYKSGQIHKEPTIRGI